MPSSNERRARSTVVTDAWYQGAFWLYLLSPLSLIYALVSYLRTFLFRLGLKSSYRSSLPVVIVGNITVGGTGKSPLVTYLVKALRERGYHPGVISRGYGASIPSDEYREVLLDSRPTDVGDEPLMLKQILDCPVYVGPNRRLTVKALEKSGCDIVISDDGLQHYALQRDIEISVFDGSRGLGNGYLLPMGPMREPRKRLKEIDFKVVNGASTIPGYKEDSDIIRMDLVPTRVRALISPESVSDRDLDSFSGIEVNAVAAIGNPERFFEVLEDNGMTVNRHSFEDHHTFREEDFSFRKDLPVIMTEKDAVKCRHLDLRDAWYLPVEAILDRNLADLIVERI